jgi:hypothetical protein
MPLTITDFSPHEGVPGTIVHVLGTDFFAGARVFFYSDAEGVGVERTSETILYARVPEGAIDGPITVRVGQAQVMSNVFFFVKDATYPRITGLAPHQGSPGTKLNIRGVNLSREGIKTVMMGDHQLRIEHHSDVEIATTVPKIKAGPYRIVVHTTEGREAEARDLFKVV